MAKISVVVADDHPIVRAGLRALIGEAGDMEVVGEASDGAGCLGHVARLKPDVILLDLSMPGLGGLATLRLILEKHPGARVLVLTVHEDPACVREILEAGGSGFLIKRAVDVELLTAIRAVCRGEIYVHSALTRDLLHVGPRPQQPHATSDPGGEPLSQREQQVLSQLARGYTNQQIADRIFLSVKTVETYRARLLEKLNLRTRAELTQYAIEHGLLGEDDPLR